VETTVRTVYSLTVAADGPRIVIRISGSGFLYNMVRIIVGTLIWAGGGRIPPERVKEILEARDRRQAGPTEAAAGLKLISIELDPEKMKNWQKIIDTPQRV